MHDEILNVSALGTPDHGKSRPTRTLRRDPLGKFTGRPVPHRTAIMADGYGGVETVTGTFLPGIKESRLPAAPRQPDRRSGATGTA
jgi:hypothetical protein